MKQLILLPVLSIGVLSATYPGANAEKFKVPSINFSADANVPNETPQQEPSSTRMRAGVFKAQDYCRAELKDFEFDARFDIVSAVVYFTGANFKSIERGTITSSSLKPVKDQMNRCVPGSVVIFDEVKVVGPDKAIRTIPGASIILY